MSPTSLKRIVPFALVLSLIPLLPASTTHAWGPSGHRIVAMIAYRHAKPSTQQKIDALLNDRRLESIANWADEVRPNRLETSRWHYADIPRNAGTFDPARDCQREKDKHGQDLGDCAIAAIKRFRPILSNKQNLKWRRAEALKFIVHFVGDLHQPLHCGDPDDQGGNEIMVKFLGQDMKLHKVWDSGIIRQAKMSDEEFAAALESTLLEDPEVATTEEIKEMKANIAEMQKGTLEEWARESHQLAMNNAYRAPSGALMTEPSSTEELSQAYYDKNWKVVDDQLLKAGLRLARILDELLA
ncbi:MAG TPA: S1/P1 nuclease [Pyrinomonadaceae bacterium]|jgi:hypothetical protein